MKVKLTLELRKVALGSGGDRYETKYKNKGVVLYFPQVISRPEGEPLKSITISIEE